MKYELSIDGAWSGSRYSLKGQKVKGRFRHFLVKGRENAEIVFFGGNWATWPDLL